MKFTVQIINYLSAEYLELCLDSVLAAAKGYEVEVLVSDNDSGDPYYPRLVKKFPTVQFQTNATNIGFGAAHNLLSKKASGEYLLILNPDVLLPETFFEKALLTIASLQGFGGIGFRMIDGEGNFLKESKRGIPSVWNAFSYFSKLSLLFPKSRLFSGYHVGWISEREFTSVNVLSGACLLVSKKTFELIGGFDERFFMYGEDIEISERLLEAGFTNYYQGGVTVLHFKGRSSAQSNQSIKHFYNSMLIYLRLKWRKKRGEKMKVQEVSKITRSAVIQQPAMSTANEKALVLELDGGLRFEEVIERIEHAKNQQILLTKSGVDWVLGSNGKMAKPLNQS